jgi:branched-chain amino acid transport system substrate-binding protein
MACNKKSTVVKIGAVLPLTGEFAKYGDSAKKGIQLAIEEINESGGINKDSLVIVFEDDQANPTKAVSALQKLISFDKVPAVIGAMPSSGTLAMAPIAEKNKVVLLSPMSTAPKITDSGDYIFRNCTSDNFEGQIMGEYATNQMKLKDFALLYIKNDYGIGLKDVFKATVEKAGGKILAEEGFEQGENNFRTTLTKIKSLKPQAVYVIGYNEMIQIFKQSSEIGLKTQYLSAIMLKDKALIDKIGKPAEGAVLTSWGYDPNSPDNAAKSFKDAFRKKYNMEPDVFACQSYDAAKLIAKAMQEKGVLPDQIKSGLYNIKNYPGASGTTTFDKNGDVIKPIDIVKIEKGNFNVISKM